MYDSFDVHEIRDEHGMLDQDQIDLEDDEVDWEELDDWVESWYADDLLLYVEGDMDHDTGDI